MPIYGLAFSNKRIAREEGDSTESVLVGVTSCKPHQNSISVLEMQESTLSMSRVAEIEEYYPCTKMQWIPQNTQFAENIFATTSDYLRLYKADQLSNGGFEIKKLVDLPNNSEFSGPLTSMDWSPFNLKTIATSSIDSTVSIWDVENQNVLT